MAQISSEGAWFDANAIMPAVVIVIVAILMRDDDKYAGLSSTLSLLCCHLRRLVPELASFLGVALCVTGGLLLRSDGILASEEQLQKLRESQPFILGLRKVWPILVHPDSLLAIQQLLRALMAAVMVARGAAAMGSSATSLKMLAQAAFLLAVSSALRAMQWAWDCDYIPEGPLGGHFAAACALISLVALLAVARKAMFYACIFSVNVARVFLGLSAIMALSMWIASANHLTASSNTSANTVFMLIEVLDMFAAPFLVAAVAAMAKRTPNLGGALAACSLAQLLNLWWFLDFYGVFEDASSPDHFERLTHDVKMHMRTVTQGCPFAIIAISQVIQSSGTVALCSLYAVIHGLDLPMGITGGLRRLSHSPMLSARPERIHL